MARNVLIWVVVIVAILILIVLALGSLDTNKESLDIGVRPSPSGGEVSQSFLVEIIGSGFSPSTLTINKGDTVTFQNIHPEESWPASAVHPTHTVYPGSGISKCGTVEESMIFDACGGISPDYGTYSFTFNEIGTWNYHDHLDSGKTGTITVVS